MYFDISPPTVFHTQTQITLVWFFFTSVCVCVCGGCCADPFCPTNSSAFWILCGVFPPGLSVFNATVSLQSLKVLGFNASVTVFFHRDHCRLPGRLHVVCMCVRALVPLLEATLCSLCTSARATEASWVRFSCGWTTYPRILLRLEACLCFFPAIIKKTNSCTVSPSYINRLCLALDSP